VRGGWVGREEGKRDRDLWRCAFMRGTMLCYGGVRRFTRWPARQPASASAAFRPTGEPQRGVVRRGEGAKKCERGRQGSSGVKSAVETCVWCRTGVYEADVAMQINCAAGESHETKPNRATRKIKNRSENQYETAMKTHRAARCYASSMERVQSGEREETKRENCRVRTQNGACRKCCYIGYFSYKSKKFGKPVKQILALMLFMFALYAGVRETPHLMFFI